MKQKILLAILMTVFLTGIQGRFARLSAQPFVDYTFTGVCIGTPTVFAVDTLITDEYAVASWDWDFGDGFFSTFQNPVHTFGGVGQYPVTLTITDTNGLVGFVTHFVDIHQLPISNFGYNTPNCANQLVQFTDLSSTTFGWINQWVWNFGDGTPNDTVDFPSNPNVQHLFALDGTYNVTLTIRNSFGCKNSSTLPVTVTPNPIANFYYTGSCEDQLVQFTDASFANGAGNIVGWQWDFGDPVSGIDNSSILQNPSHIFSVADTFYVTLIVTNFTNCSDTIIKPIVIYQSPPVDYTYSPACLSELTFFTADTSVMDPGSIATWHWDFGDGISNNNVQSTSHAFLNQGTYTVTLTVTDTSGCINTVSHDILINPLPIAHFSVSASTCSGNPVIFTNLSTTTAFYVVKWFWQFGDGTDTTILFPANPNIAHIYTVGGTYAVTLTVTASDSCIGTETQNVIVHPNPIANFHYDQSCFGIPVVFTDLSQSNGGGSLVDWNWNFGDPVSGVNNVSTIPNPSHQFTTPGSYIVTLVVTTSNGCSATITDTLDILPAPAVAFTSMYRCQNTLVQFFPDATVMNTSIIAIWHWDFGDGITSDQQQPSHQYVLSGPYQVTLTVTDTSGCSNFIVQTVLIVPKPVANFDYSSPTCFETPTIFTNLSNAPYGYLVKYVWNFGDGNSTTINWPTNPNVSHTFPNYGNFNVTLTVTTNDSCTGFISKTITVVPNPLANFIYQSSCIGAVIFNDQSQSGGGGSLIDWQWNFGDPTSGAGNFSTIQDPTHTYLAAGIYQVSLIVTSSTGCSDTITNQVTIYPAPLVDFSSVAGCMNDTTQFVCSTFVNPGATTAYLWQFGDATTSSEIDPVHLYAQAGTYTVTLAITDTAGCTNTISHFVTIVTAPASFFVHSTPACSNYPVQFNDMSTTSAGQITSWHWDFGDGSDTLITPPGNPDIEHTYSTFGTYTVVLTVATSIGCENEFSLVVTITTGPLAGFSYGNTCEASAVDFTDLTTTNGGTNLVSWLWNFGDPISGTNNISILQNPSHLFSGAGNYIINLQVTNANGCIDTTLQTITVLPLPAVEFGFGNPNCLGASTTFYIDSIVTNLAVIQQIDWDFGDGSSHSSLQNPTHTYAIAGIFTVLLSITDTSGCGNVISHTFEIHPLPVPRFSYSNACSGDTTKYIDESFTINGELISNWHWNFGDPSSTNDTSSIQNPTWTYTADGSYTVTLTVITPAGCSDSISIPIQVYRKPNANFNYTASPCDNGAVYFQDSSYANQATIASWLWEFDPFQYSDVQNPVYVFFDSDSCYNVKLIVTDMRGCMDTTTKLVCVPAQLNVAVNIPETCYLQTTSFTPQLIDPVGDSLISFAWNFGEPSSGFDNTSTLRDPTHTYNLPGSYSVTLQVIDIHNCPQIIYKQVIVKPLPVPSFTYTEGNCDSIATFDASSTGGGAGISKWIWDYGDGNTVTVDAPGDPDLPHFYSIPGMYNVSLTVINLNNCSATFSDSLLLKPCIEAIFEKIDTLGCQNQLFTFADSSYCGLPISQWDWDFGDGITISYTSWQPNVTHVFGTSGIFSVKLRVSTLIASQIVSDSLTLLVNINPSPIAKYNAADVCYGLPAVFDNTSSANGTQISSYEWTFGVPGTTDDSSSVKNPSYTYTVAGSYDVDLIVNNTIGCTDTVTHTIHVNPLPNAFFDMSSSCSGSPTTFTDRSDSALAPLVGWRWMYADTSGTVGVDTARNAVFTFANAGDYIIRLIVADTNGCLDTLNQPLTTNPIPTTAFTFKENYQNVQGQLLMQDKSVDAIQYQWDFGNGVLSGAENPIVTYTEDGDYVIELITWNSFNCTDTVRTDYHLLFKGLFIPNAFAPTSPFSTARYFKPIGINLLSFKIEVFDTWGNVLWHSVKLDEFGRPTESWDGTYQGQLLPQDVYVWKAQAVFRDGTIWNSQDVGTYKGVSDKPYGTVTLIR
ncbi:MAG: PKD domain-containing protein [Bacteroidota bacterium]